MYTWAIYKLWVAIYTWGIVDWFDHIWCSQIPCEWMDMPRNCTWDMSCPKPMFPRTGYRHFSSSSTSSTSYHCLQPPFCLHLLLCKHMHTPLKCLPEMAGCSKLLSSSSLLVSGSRDSKVWYIYVEGEGPGRGWGMLGKWCLNLMKVTNV